MKFQTIESKATILDRTKEELQSNCAYACSLKLPECNTNSDTVLNESWVICAGGPSLVNSLEDIRVLYEKGHKIVSLGGTYDLLVRHGLTPDYYIMGDASPYIAGFFNPTLATKYLVSSQCNKVVFDKLKGFNVSLWHPLDFYDNEPIIRNAGISSRLVPGGSTTALRSFELGFLIGVRDFYYFGVDSSASDEELYAYTLKEGNRDKEEDKVLYPVYLVFNNGNTIEFHTTVDLACQASEFLVLCKKYEKALSKGVCPLSIAVRGSGLIPTMWNVYMALKGKDPKFDIAVAIKEGIWDAYKAQ